MLRCYQPWYALLSYMPKTASSQGFLLPAGRPMATASLNPAVAAHPISAYPQRRGVTPAIHRVLPSMEICACHWQRSLIFTRVHCACTILIGKNVKKLGKAWLCTGLGTMAHLSRESSHSCCTAATAAAAARLAQGLRLQLCCRQAQHPIGY